MSKVGYVYDPSMLLHFGYNQVEVPERILIIYEKLKELNYLNKMIKIDSHFIEKDELLLAHSEDFINKMDDLFELSENQIILALGKMNSMFGNKNSLISAKVAAGSTLNLMKNILNKNIDRGIAIVRPPFHHCSKNEAGGFCFFNGVAIASKYAIKMGYKVAIVDFDCHFCNGTYDILKHNNNSLLISVHRYDYGKFYPGTGKAMNTENVLSIPLNHEAYDEDYYEIFDKMVIPKLGKFNPDIIIVSAGFDAAEGDPIGGFHLTPNCYYNMTKKLLNFNKPLMLVLEGGYNLQSIANSMAECTRAILDL